MYVQWRYKSSLPVNIVHCANERKIVFNDGYRDQLCSRIYRQAVLLPSFQFQRVWTKLSKQPVCIGLDRRMYFNCHTECYSNDGAKGLPHLQYCLPVSKSKIWAVVLYHYPIRTKTQFPEQQNTCLAVLTSDGYIKILDADKGEVLRSVYISTDIVFRYLSWAEYSNTIQVKSVKAARQNEAVLGTVRGRVLSLMIFKIHPLRFVTYFHIDKHLFGNDIRDAAVSEDLLMVITNSTCRYYDLGWIIKNCTTIDVDLTKSVRVSETSSYFHPGVYPNSIPVTVQMTETPPLLFTTKCSPELGVSFGGSPVVYLHNANPANINKFQIKELQTEKLVGTLKTDVLAFHQDVAEFHFDDFKRIIHISGCTVSCYRLHQLESSSTLQLMYHIDFKRIFHENVEMPKVSGRGRVIKRTTTSPSCFDDFVSAVQDLDYENELDLLYAVITMPEGEGTKALLCFINESNGTIDKIVPLPTWDSSAGNSIYYELDCIIHLVQGDSQNTCHFYRLTRT